MHREKRGVVRSGNGDYAALMPRLLVWVRAGTRNARDAWHKLQRRLVLGSAHVQDSVFGTSAFEVWGAAEALNDLTLGVHPIVVGYEYWDGDQPDPDVRPAGAGEPSQRKRVARLPGERHNTAAGEQALPPEWEKDHASVRSEGTQREARASHRHIEAGQRRQDDVQGSGVFVQP